MDVEITFEDWRVCGCYDWEEEGEGGAGGGWLGYRTGF